MNRYSREKKIKGAGIGNIIGARVVLERSEELKTGIRNRERGQDIVGAERGIF